MVLSASFQTLVTTKKNHHHRGWKWGSENHTTTLEIDHSPCESKHIWDSPTVDKKNAPLADRSCSSSLNGSDLEQMVHNRIGRHSLEWVEIWNQSLWYNSIVVSYNDGSSHMYMHNHMKTTNKIK